MAESVFFPPFQSFATSFQHHSPLLGQRRSSFVDRNPIFAPYFWSPPPREDTALFLPLPSFCAAPNALLEFDRPLFGFFFRSCCVNYSSPSPGLELVSRLYEAPCRPSAIPSPMGRCFSSRPSSSLECFWSFSRTLMR